MLHMSEGRVSHIDPHIHVLISVIHACSKTLSRLSSGVKNISFESRNKNYRTSIDGQTRVQVQVCCINHHVCYSVVLIKKCLLCNRYMMIFEICCKYIFKKNSPWSLRTFFFLAIWLLWILRSRRCYCMVYLVW